jgi:predicted phage baseplate assembly protein
MNHDTTGWCGCCAGRAATTPVPVANRPGLSAIAYRVGTHSAFLSTMLARLSAGGPDAAAAADRLAALRARTTADFAVALLDAWATVADVTTFYSERIANESYLRTATERRSLRELARLLGYRPRPGLAAATRLAFTVDRDVLIEAGTRVQSLPTAGEQPVTFETAEPLTARPGWNALRPKLSLPSTVDTGATTLTVTGAAGRLRAGDALVVTAGTTSVIRWITDVQPDPDGRRATVTLHPRVDEPAVSGAQPPAGVIALAARASLHGHNAPDPTTVPETIRADWPAPPRLGDRQLGLAALYPDWAPGGWVLVTWGRTNRKPVLAQIEKTVEETLVVYTVSNAVTLLTLAGAGPVAPTSIGELRAARVHGASIPLSLAPVPLTTPLRAGDSAIVLDADPGLPAGRQVVVCGDELSGGGPVSEVATVVPGDGRPAVLRLAAGLSRDYRRDSVTINANVVPATQGESVREVLGGGDASRPYQRLPLRRSPVTHLPAGTDGTGAHSTVDIHLDGVRWHEAPTLYGRGPAERIFVTETADSGRTSVRFGDGRTGARPPSGVENVVAGYRFGQGRAGNLEPGRLTRLVSGPAGVRDVTNPVPATGGADGDGPDELRTNAALAVRTLGRVVSLRDYEDFARAYAGIGKALATWTWHRGRRVVLLTVAGPDGDPVPDTDPRHGGLLDALRRAGDPAVAVYLASYTPMPFKLDARVRVEPDLDPATVRAAVAASLSGTFGFRAREFGQPVAYSEVVAAMHRVPGVAAVDIRVFARADGPIGVATRLTAGRPQWTDVGGFRPAELLTIEPTGPWLGEL